MRKNIANHISDIISERLKTALKTETDANAEEPVDVAESQSNSNVETTNDELQGFYIVKAILCAHVDIDRIAFRDAQTYFAILFDDNNRKPICRLHFNGKQKFIETFDCEKKGTKHPVNSMDDIYKVSSELIEIAKGYCE